MRKICLVACGKTKLRVPAKAKDLYVSALFRKSRRWAEENCNEWYVLSAKYGLVHPEQVIGPYELTLKSFRAIGRARWASRVFETMRSKGILRPDSKFIWLAGRDYSEQLSQLLKSYSQADPLEGLRMGERMEWFGNQLTHPKRGS